MPKKRAAQDNRAWRLSFSMAEHALASSVGEKARKTYLAVKMIVKRKLRAVCPFLKSYHIKTVFFHYMETKTEEFWEETELETSIKDLLGLNMSYHYSQGFVIVLIFLVFREAEKNIKNYFRPPKIFATS